ncbi:MAG: carbohydrate ABC transporter substrate-binding protein [Myxococcales bacterium]|nr:MAG: carbohydrate ABC transporter substrate-binding protein [Myxococcales bacterium]
MSRSLRSWSWSWSAGLTLLLAGCGSSGDGGDDGQTDGTPQKVTVEVFSWWTAPGEAEALQSLIDLHKDRYPNARIFNAATDPALISGGTEAKQVLRERLEAGDPPDSFQTNAFELKTGFLANTPNLLAPLDDLFAEGGLEGDVVPELLSDVTVDGHVMAVPVNVHRENSLFFNMSVLKEHGVKAPKTMAEFLAACKKLKGEGVTPLAISTSQGWIINKVFVALALGALGPEKFVKYFIDKEPVEADDLDPVIALLDEVLTDYIDVETAAADGYGWTQAADALHDGEAAMFIHGDWAKGYLTQLGWTPNVDFGVAATPDSEGVFLYGTDVFALPQGAKHPEDALNWLRTIASSDGQISFNEAKGSVPVRLNLKGSGLDAMASQTYTELKDATQRLRVVSLPAEWDNGFVQLAQDHDRAALLQAFIEHPIP